MAKLTASLTRKFSVELTDGQWESAEASCSEEDTFREYLPHVAEPESEEEYREAKARFHAAMRAEVKAQVDAEMKRQRDEVLGDGYAAQSVAEAFADEAGAKAEYTPAEESKPPQPSAPLPPTEEQPPLPSEEVVRTPIAEGQATFKVRYFEVAETSGGDKYLRCYGRGSWKREWVPAWSDVAELLFDDIESMDLGEIQTPYPLEATVMMKDDTYKGKKFRTADKVVEWTRVG